MELGRAPGRVWTNATRRQAWRWWAHTLRRDVTLWAGDWRDWFRAERQTCPRRLEDFGPQSREPLQDIWRHDGTCSFCGGLKPERFFSLVLAGAEVEPTDKGYKAYVKDGGTSAYPIRPTHKVYFQHFSQLDREHFVRLYNEERMKLGYPGHFYVLPYFLRLAPGAKKGQA